MDPQTLCAYDRDAGAFAADWDAQPAPSGLRALVRRFFRAGATADIGCGSGRDAAWLNAHGFPTVGYDASEGLLAEARRRHPAVEFRRAALPDLAGIDHRSFVNVLCETVIMHLPAAVIAASVRRLLAILRPGGTLYLSWRVTETADVRDDRGRLYAAFDPGLVLRVLAAAEILLDEQRISLSSGKPVRRVIARTTDAASTATARQGPPA